jgi:hypothetical protein
LRKSINHTSIKQQLRDSEELEKRNPNPTHRFSYGMFHPSSLFVVVVVVSLIPACRIELGNEVKRGRKSKHIFLGREFYFSVFILLISSYICMYVAALKKLEF